MVSTNIKSDVHELDWLKYLFQKVQIPLSMTQSGPAAGKLGLFKSDPRSTVGTLPPIDDAASKEPTSGEYASYARLSVTRDTTEWTCATAAGVSTVTKATNDAIFAAAGGGSTGCVVSWVGYLMGRSDATGDMLLYAFQLETPITVTAGVAPRVAFGDLVLEEK